MARGSPRLPDDGGSPRGGGGSNNISAPQHPAAAPAREHSTNSGVSALKNWLPVFGDPGATVQVSAAEITALREKAARLEATSSEAREADRLSCSICFEPYAIQPVELKKSPRILPCGHTFCEGCLSLILSELTLPTTICDNTDSQGRF